MKHQRIISLFLWMSLIGAGCATDMGTARSDIVAPDAPADDPAFDAAADSVAPDPPAEDVAQGPLAEFDPLDPPVGDDPADVPGVTVAPESPAEVDTREPPTDNVAPDQPAMDSGNTNRLASYHDPQLTNLGVEVSCAQCHGQDGAGGQNAAGRPVGGILGLSADVLAAHMQGNADHPAPTGRVDIRFPNLTADDFDAIASFLSHE